MSSPSAPRLRGRPGSALWLMGHELRLYWRRGKMNPKSGLIVIGLMMTFWVGITWLLFYKVGHFIPPPPFVEGAGAGIALLAVSLIIGFIASVMVSQAILGAVEAIYTRNDLDLLVSSPLSPWTVLIVRSSAIAIGGLPLYAGLLGPPLVWLAIYSSPLWLFSLVFLVALAFGATGIALLVVNALFRLIGPGSTRVLAQIFAALSAASVFLAFQSINLVGGGKGSRGEQMVAWITSLNIQPTSPWLSAARAMTANLPDTLLWIAGCALIFPLGVYIFSRSFVADAAAASGMGRKQRTTDARIAAVRGGAMASVIRKELRLLARDPVLLSQIGLQIVYLLPLGFVLLRPGGAMPLTEAAFAPALTLLSSALAGSLIWITVSAEDAPDLIASAPIARRTVDRAKLVAAVGPVLVPMAILLVALISRAWPEGLWATAGVLAGTICAALVGLWRRAPGSRKEFVRRRQKGSVLSSLGQTFMSLGISATVGLGAYGYPWLAIIPAIMSVAILGALYKAPETA
jgi:ABC-2 type transport system permease protein